MSTYLAIAEIIVSILLIVSILIQQRGSALGSAFGGDGGGFYSTRRGFQQKLFIVTIILGVLFIALAVANLLV
jgi:protein translocase SecG subunit